MMPEATVTQEESNYRAKYYKGIASVKQTILNCSSCGNVISFGADNYNSHPCLGILLCQPCHDKFRHLKASVKTKNWKKRCLMCGSDECQTLFECPVKDCPYSFCKKCIKRNAASALLIADTPNWKCFVCMTNPLWEARGVCATLLASSPRRRKKLKMVRDDSSDDYDDVPVQKNSRGSRKTETSIRPKRTTSRTSKAEKEADVSEDDIEIVSVKPTKSVKSRSGRTSKRQVSTDSSTEDRGKTPASPARHRSTSSPSTKSRGRSQSPEFPNRRRRSIERSKSPESICHRRTSANQNTRKTRGASVEKVLPTQGLEKLRHQNSDSSSGKEFTKTKLVKDQGVIKLQRASIGNTDFTEEVEEDPSSPVGTMLTKQQLFSLKNSVQEFIKELKAMSKQMLIDADTLQRQYSQRDMIKPLEATKWIVECKNINSSWKEQIDNSEHKLVNKFRVWSKKNKFKNIFVSENGIDVSVTPTRSGLETTRKGKEVVPQSSSDEEENAEKKDVPGEARASSDSVEKTPEVSDCESSEIFTQDEGAAMEQNDVEEPNKVLSPVHEEMDEDPSDAEHSARSALSRKSKSAETLADDSRRSASRKNINDDSSNDMFAESDTGSDKSPENVSPGPKCSKRSGGKKPRKSLDVSNSEGSKEDLNGSAGSSRSPEKSQKTGSQSKKLSSNHLPLNSSSDEEVIKTKNDGRKKLKSSEKKRRSRDAPIPTDSDEEVVNSKDSKKNDKTTIPVFPVVNTATTLVEPIDKGRDILAEEIAKALLRRSNSSSEEPYANSSDKSPIKETSVVKNDSNVTPPVATDTSDIQEDKPKKSKRHKQKSNSSPRSESLPEGKSKRKSKKRSSTESQDTNVGNTNSDKSRSNSSSNSVADPADIEDHANSVDSDGSEAGVFMPKNSEKKKLSNVEENAKKSLLESSDDEPSSSEQFQQKKVSSKDHSDLSDERSASRSSDELDKSKRKFNGKRVSAEEKAKQSLLESSDESSDSEHARHKKEWSRTTDVNEASKDSSRDTSDNEELAKSKSDEAESPSKFTEASDTENDKSKEKLEDQTNSLNSTAEEQAKESLLRSDSSDVDEAVAFDGSEKSDEKLTPDPEERARQELLNSDSSSDETNLYKSNKSVEQSDVDKSKVDVLNDEVTKDSVLEPDNSLDKTSESTSNKPDQKSMEKSVSDSSDDDVGKSAKSVQKKQAKDSSKEASGSEEQSESDSNSRDAEKEAKTNLLETSDEGSDDIKIAIPKKAVDKSDDSSNSCAPSRAKKSRLDRKKLESFYKADKKLKIKCSVVLERLSNRILRKHAKALKKSREYLEDKEIKSLTTLDGLEKTRKRNNGNGSDTDTTSTSRTKKKSKETEDTLMDHLNANGEQLNAENSSSEEMSPKKSHLLEEPLNNADDAAKNGLLESSDSEKPIELSSDEGSVKNEKKKAEKKSQEKKPAEKKPKKSSGSSSEESEGSPSKSSKSDWKRNKLLTMKLSSSDEEQQSQKFEKKVQKLSQKVSDDSDVGEVKAKKKRTRRRRLNSDSDIKLTDESVSSDSEASKKSEKPEKVGKKRAKKVESSGSDSSTTKARPKPKRRRIRTAGTDSDSDIEEVHNSQGGSPIKGRKNIRKVLKDKQVADDTKQAAKVEEERIKRMAERQKLYNEMYEARLASEAKVDKLILDFDEESKEELLSVHEELVKRLKPHQAQGIKFMWDACFESLERTKTTKGSGCILAHCMGLGKSFQVVTLTHTLLLNSDKTGVNTVLIVCPLSTVLNWVNEFKIWLEKVNDGDDVEVYEMTKLKKHIERKFMLERWQKTGGVLIIGYEMYRILSSPTTKITKKTRESFFKCLVEPGPDLVVCDEGHLLKSESTAINQAMSNIRTLRRVVLTGTPLQNNLTEYHCMVQFVKPNLLGTKKEFLNRFVNPIQNGQFDNSTEYDVKVMKKRAHVLHKMLEGSVQRLDYSVLTPFLPPKQEYVIFIKLSELQVQLYQYYIDNLARKGKRMGGSLFADFQALQRVWTHPIAIKLNADKTAEKKLKEESDSEGSLRDFIDDGSSDDSSKSDSTVGSGSSSGSKNSEVVVKRSTRANPTVEEVEEEPVPEPPSEWWNEFIQEEHFEDLRISGKLRILFEIIKECEAIGDKVLVFSQSLYSLTLIEKFLEMIDDATQRGTSSELIDGHTGSWSLGVDYFRLDGQSSTDNRNRWCKIFNRPTNTRARLFLISTRAGGLGINLTAANRVVIFDASWNPSHDVQSIFRIYRFGQKKPCYVYRLLAAGTMEEKIYNRQVTKLSLSCRVVDEQQIERHYTNSDLAELYTFDPPSETTATIGCPKDRLLAEIFIKYKNLVNNFHEHDSLLENKADEELDDEERMQAWAEYEQEKAGRPAFNPMMNAGIQYVDPMVQQNQMNLYGNGGQMNELANLFSMYQRDYPNLPPEQLIQMTNKRYLDMYNYMESQTMVNAVNNRVINPMMQAGPSSSNPTNTLANQLAQEAYTRHHQQAKMTPYQKQLLYAQQHGNYKTVAANMQRPVQNTGMYRQPNILQRTPVVINDPDIEVLPTPGPSNTTGQLASGQSKPRRYKEE